MTHGYYHRKQPSGETDPLFTAADNVALKQEAALIRVTLHRLSEHLLNNDLPVEKITSIAPLIFTGTRALAYIQRQVIEKDDKENIDNALDFGFP